MADESLPAPLDGTPPPTPRQQPSEPLVDPAEVLCRSWDGWNDALGCGAEIGCGLLVLMLGVGTAGTAAAAHWFR